MSDVIPLRNQTQKLRMQCPSCHGETHVFVGHEREMFCDECLLNNREYLTLVCVGIVPEKDWRG